MDNNLDDENIIKAGDHVVVQRQGYTKLHKVKKSSKLILGTFNVEMSNIIGSRYFDMFQIKNVPGGKNLYTLEKVEEINSASGTLNIEESGKDNRNIPNNAESQNLTKEDIDKLKEERLSSNSIIGELINNSKTFNMKTGYSQEKYIKKKEKKYFEYIQLRRPSIRLLAQMFYRQDYAKTLGIRIDDLSQMLTYANIHQEGNHLLYDSGTSGLMTAAITNAIGARTTGHLIHMHPGNECQKNAFVAMQFPREQATRCINVNIYSVLRCYYQNKNSYSETTKETEKIEMETDNISKEPGGTLNSLQDNSKESKSTINEKQMSKAENIQDEKNEHDSDAEPLNKKVKLDDTLQKKSWQLDNERACRLLEKKVDSLIITAKEHPVNIITELIPLLNGNRNLVVFNLLREPLQDLYFYLKSRTDVVNIRFVNSFMRTYQVLPARTHPEVNMTNGGYILTATKLNC